MLQVRMTPRPSSRASWCSWLRSVGRVLQQLSCCKLFKLDLFEFKHDDNGPSMTIWSPLAPKDVAMLLTGIEAMQTVRWELSLPKHDGAEAGCDLQRAARAAAACATCLRLKLDAATCPSMHALLKAAVNVEVPKLRVVTVSIRKLSLLDAKRMAAAAISVVASRPQQAAPLVIKLQNAQRAMLEDLQSMLQHTAGSSGWVEVSP
jgi:hypothetical protein